jgi:hypothetical protein
MSAFRSDSAFLDEPYGFDSRDSEVVVSDGPGNTTIRPLRPQLLQLALAERQRLARLQELMNQLPTAEEPSNGSPRPRSDRG